MSNARLKRELRVKLKFPTPQALLAQVGRVPGVEAADGTVSGYAQFVARNGKAISTGGSPTLGVSFDPHSQISALRVIAGGPPRTSEKSCLAGGNVASMARLPSEAG